MSMWGESNRDKWPKRGIAQTESASDGASRLGYINSLISGDLNKILDNNPFSL